MPFYIGMNNECVNKCIESYNKIMDKLVLLGILMKLRKKNMLNKFSKI